jgi:D-3-phosphoglycerate dehydrogenase / 2-oxoglutarate reductase
MPKPKVYVLDPYHDEAITKLLSISTFTPVLRDDPQNSKWQEDADALLIRSDTKLGPAQLSKCKKLKAVVKISLSPRYTLS